MKAFFCFLFLINLKLSIQDDSSAYPSLRKTLLSGYDTHIKPTIDSEQAINISILVTFERLISVDSKASTVTFESYMILNWTDQHLTWNPADYQGIDHVDLNPKEIWTPTIIASTAWTNFYEEDDLDLEVDSKGKVLWIRMLVISYRCAMDLTNYPFDEQHCFLPIYPNFDASNFINLIPFGELKKPAMNLAHSTNPEWTVSLDRNVLANMTIRNNITRPFLHITMILKRRFAAHHYIIVMPYFAANLLVFYSFFLPLFSRKRIFIGILALFVDISLISLLGYELGFDSNHNTPYAVKCLSINMVLIGIFIITSVLGSQFIVKSSSDAPMLIQGLVKNNVIQKFLLIQFSGKELSDLNTELGKLKRTPSLSVFNVQTNDWILFITVLDRIYMIIYIITFIVFHS